jgi:hypothetical protein
MILYPPNNLTRIPEGSISIFLAGSIEMGKANNWQADLSLTLEQMEFVVLNPRRKDWDSSWGQSFEDANFAQQVNWELDALEVADLILFYFAGGTNSIVSMLELGLMIGKYPKSVAVVCSPDYCRKGNIDILCYRDGIMQFDCMEGALASLARTQIHKNVKSGRL